MVFTTRSGDKFGKREGTSPDTLFPMRLAWLSKAHKWSSTHPCGDNHRSRFVVITTMVALESAQLEAPAPAEGISDAALEEKTQQLHGLIKDISKEEASKGEAPCEKDKKQDALMQLYDDAQHNGVDVKGPWPTSLQGAQKGASPQSTRSCVARARKQHSGSNGQQRSSSMRSRSGRKRRASPLWTNPKVSCGASRRCSRKRASRTPLSMCSMGEVHCDGHAEVPQ